MCPRAEDGREDIYLLQLFTDWSNATISANCSFTIGRANDESIGDNETSLQQQQPTEEAATEWIVSM